MDIIEGKSVFQGIGEGKFISFSDNLSLSTEQKNIDFDEETARYLEAKKHVGGVFLELYDKALLKTGRESAEIINAQKMILEDEEFDALVKGYIQNEGIGAPEALLKARDYFCDVFEQSNEDKLMARSEDVCEISHMLFKELKGLEDDPLDGILREKGKIILYSDRLSTSVIIRLGKEKIAGLCSKSDSLNSHALVLARSMGIPALISCTANSTSYDGKNALIDAYEGKVYIEPGDELKQSVYQKETVYAQKKRTAPMSVNSRQNTKIRIYANIGSVEEIDEALQYGAEGVGLFRTEYIFMDSYDFPTLDEQFEMYKEAVVKADGRELIIRTADIGGDKKVSYIEPRSDANPALGLRGIRFSLSHPGMFKTQLKAILMAGAYGKISLMFPMIVSVDEIRKCREYIDAICVELKENNIPYDGEIKIGAMIETPAAALTAGEIAKEVDFFSVGSNDLTQYTLAADRCNAAVEKIFDSRHPAVLKMLENIAAEARKNGIKAGICGELCTEADMVKTLYEMGYDSLSVPISKLTEILKAAEEL